MHFIKKALIFMHCSCLIRRDRQLSIFSSNSKISGHKLEVYLCPSLARITSNVDEKHFQHLLILALIFHLAGWREFKKLPLTTKVVIAASVIMFMILVLLATVFCCKRNRASTADQVKIKPPSYDEVITTKTKVPMQPLINEV